MISGDSESSLVPGQARSVPPLRPGAATSRKPIVVKPAGGATPAAGRVSVHGRVLDATGHGVAAAVVVWGTDVTNPEDVHTQDAGKDGRFTLEDLPRDGVLFIQAGKPGLCQSSPSWPVQLTEDMELAPIVLTAGRSVEGVITDLEGNLLGEVRILGARLPIGVAEEKEALVGKWLETWVRAGLVPQAWSDEHGRFRLAGISGSSGVDLELEKEGYATGLYRVGLRASDDEPQEVVLEMGPRPTLEVRVHGIGASESYELVLETLNSAAGKQARGWIEESTAIEGSRSVTEHELTYAPATYRVKVTWAGGAPSEQRIDVVPGRRSSVDLHLERGHVIEGRVVDADSKEPVAEAGVLLIEAGDPKDRFRQVRLGPRLFRGQARTLTDAAGLFSVRFSAAEADLIVVKKGYAPRLLLAIDAARVPSRCTVPLEHGGVVRTRLLDPEGRVVRTAAMRLRSISIEEGSELGIPRNDNGGGAAGARELGYTASPSSLHQS